MVLPKGETKWLSVCVCVCVCVCAESTAGVQRTNIVNQRQARISDIMSFPPSSYVFRLVLSRFEFEGVSTGENALEAGEDEEEVWLFWRDSNKEVRSKSVRELAQDAKEGQKEDRDVLGYYRCAGLCTGALWCPLMRRPAERQMCISGVCRVWAVSSAYIVGQCYLGVAWSQGSCLVASAPSHSCWSLHGVAHGCSLW